MWDAGSALNQQEREDRCPNPDLSLNRRCHQDALNCQDTPSPLGHLPSPARRGRAVPARGTSPGLQGTGARCEDATAPAPSALLQAGGDTAHKSKGTGKHTFSYT